ncbi:MAG: GNAT family N-acetyltransferase [Thermomicrobiales bacterium]|nr:GNAT family N-acetyltransferase [Thermomicrobiales bacterium]
MDADRVLPLVTPTSAELIHAIAEHPHGLLDAMEALPGAAFHREQGVTWYTTPVVSPMFAGAMRVDLGEGEVDERIDRISAEMTAAGVPYAFWWVGPETRPADLGERLIAHGLAPWEIDAPGMAVEIERIHDNLATPAGLRIERVFDAAGLLDWKTAMVDGLEVPEFAGQAWVDATTQLGIAHAPWRLLTGYLDDRPVAVAGVIGVAGVASVFAVATVPETRRQGIGGAITAAGLRLMRAEGYRWGVLFSSEMGEPVYRRLGFRTYCHISRYLWRNPNV